MRDRWQTTIRHAARRPGLLLAGALLLAGCSTGSRDGADDSGTAGSQAGSPRSDSVAGVTWVIHDRWTRGGERPMRVATYVVPRSQGDLEDAECAVYYFGPGQGGDVATNLERWYGQFEQAGGVPSRDVAKSSTWSANGIEITTTYLEGTYRGMGGPMGGSAEPKPGFAMFGAIAEGPQGRIFFKMVGPKQTVTDARDEFFFTVGSIDRTGG